LSLSPRGRVADCDYLLDRADAEINAADRSFDTCAKGVHRKLASLYLDRVFGENVDESAGSPPTPFEKRRILASPFRLLRPLVEPDTSPDFGDILAELDSVPSPAEPA
jgi:hypothetical protein